MCSCYLSVSGGKAHAENSKPSIREASVSARGSSDAKEAADLCLMEAALYYASILCDEQATNIGAVLMHTVPPLRSLIMHLTKDVPDKTFSWLRSLCSTHLSCFIAFSLLIPSAYAQYGDSLCGVVRDLQQDLVSSATVSFSSIQTNEQQANISSGEGIYPFNTRPPHFFTTGETVDFSTLSHQQKVIPGQSNALNTRLEVACTTGKAVNGGLASVLDTETVSLGETISSIQIQRLPLHNQDIYQLAQVRSAVFDDGSRRSGENTSIPGNQESYATHAYCCFPTPASNYPKRVYNAAKCLPNSTTIMNFGINNLPTIGQPILVMDLFSDSTTIAKHPDLLGTKYHLPYNVVASISYERSQPDNLLVQSSYKVSAGTRGVALSPYSNFIDYSANTEPGNLDALIVTLKHSFAHHFILEVQYALATAMDENHRPFKLTGRWHLLHWFSIEPGLQRPNSIGSVLHRKALLH
jgi:hypothetical protein